MNHTSRLKVSRFICLWMTWVAHFDHYLWLFLVSLDSFHWNFFNGTSDVIIVASMCLQNLFFFVFFSLLSFHCNFVKRDEIIIIKNNNEILKAHQSFNDDIINIVEKISTRKTQQNQERSLTITEVDHTSHLKASEPWYLRTIRMTYFINHWWFLLMFFYLFYRDYFNNIDDIIIIILNDGHHSRFFLC